MLRLSDAERVRDGRRRRAGRAERQGDQAPHGCYVQRGVESPVNPLKRRLRGYRALSAGGFAVAVVRSPPKFVVSLVVLRRTTERV